MMIHLIFLALRFTTESEFNKISNEDSSQHKTFEAQIFFTFILIETSAISSTIFGYPTEALQDHANFNIIWPYTFLCFQGNS